MRLLEQWRDVIRPVSVTFQGSGEPDSFDFGTAVPVRGDLFLRLDGSSGSRLYVKTTTSGTDGWEAVG